MLIMGAVIYVIAIVGLTLFAVIYTEFPAFTFEGESLVVFFDLIFGYRLYRSLKLIKLSRNGKKFEVPLF